MEQTLTGVFLTRACFLSRDEGWVAAMDKLLLVFVCLLMPMSSVLSAQGYSIRDNRIVVQTKDDWMQWRYPKDVVEITDDGKVRPVYIRKDINACLDALSFIHDDDVRGGIRNAGSNQEDAINVVDGDLHTCWEPDSSDPLTDWWIEVDLGRLVSALRIVIRFAENGDPFLGFKVQTWSKDLTQSGEADWVTVGRLSDLPSTRHTFDFELEPYISAGGNVQEGIKGDVVQYVRVVATDTRGSRAGEIGKEEYERLDPDLRGTIDYIRITPAGEEKLIDRVGYEKLDPALRGSIRYYRREVPRVTEVEVWSVGDNVILGALERGGSSDLPVIADGDFGTFSRLPRTEERITGVEMDLGTTFWIDTVRLILNPSASLYGYRILGSDASRAMDGSMIWKMLTSASRWVPEPPGSQFLLVRTEDRFQAEKTRYVTVQLHLAGWQESRWTPVVREFQLYGEGYIPEVVITSPLIEVGKSKSLSSIEWDADMAPGTSVEICTRTGDMLKEEVRYFDAEGKEVTGHEYHKLPSFRRGEKKTEMEPGDDWSMWSHPYVFPVDEVSSPNPREYLQIQTRLLSDDPKACATLRSLQIRLFAPLTERIAGEIYPTRAQREGESQEFSLYLHPSFAPFDIGFDQILVHSPSRAHIRFRALHIGMEDEYAEGKEEVFGPEELDIRPTRPDSLWVLLTHPILPGREELIRIDFSSRIYLNGTAFAASVMHSSSPDTPQRVDEGDATRLVQSEEMRVFIPVERRVIRSVEISPDPFTPNGDGINDEVEISFSVFRVYVSVPVQVEIRDLSGKRVRRIEHQREESSGGYAINWDGRDEEGRKVRPGVYVIRIGMEDASEEEAKDIVVMGAVSVAY